MKRFIINKPEKATLLAMAFAIFTVSCNDEEQPESPYPGFETNVISFSAQTDDIDTRATTSFPNSVNGEAQAAVIAYYSNSTNWESLYIDHAKADVKNKNATQYELTWADKANQYWPDNYEELTFMSYNPVKAKNSNNNLLLNVALSPLGHTSTEDVIVAGPVKQSAKNPHTPVNLMFTHIMSQLEILLGTDTEGMIVENVKIEIANSDKTYNLLSGQWLNATNSSVTYNFNKSYVLNKDEYASLTEVPILLLPNTEKDIKITIFKKIEGILYENSIKLNEIEKLSLQKSKKTVLSFFLSQNVISLEEIAECTLAEWQAIDMGNKIADLEKIEDVQLEILCKQEYKDKELDLITQIELVDADGNRYKANTKVNETGQLVTEGLSKIPQAEQLKEVTIYIKNKRYLISSSNWSYKAYGQLNFFGI